MRLNLWELSQPRFYEQILNVGTHTFKKFFLIFLRRTHVNKINGSQFYRNQ